MNNEIKSYLHIALVLDASGSMDAIRKFTIDSLKTFFDSFRSKDDKTVLDVWQFNETVYHLVNGVDINAGAGDTLESYKPEGGTALYDAVCEGIDELGRKFAAMREEDRPDGVIFAILTDGFENSSTDFSAGDVKARITHQSEKYGWQFRFLAANQDAITAGADLGIRASHCANFSASEAGMAEVCASEGLFHKSCCSVRESARTARKAKKGK